MAKDSRDRRREREDEQEAVISKHRHGVAERTGAPIAPGEIPTGADKFEDLVERAGPMIDQLNNLYNMFFAGAERLPPIERRKQLDQIINTLTLMPKPTSNQRFRFATVQNQYITFRDKWDKQMRDLEAGKKRRAVGPPGKG